jgi:3-phosphoshikimate 1-carboxyvinyltransferase
MDVKIIPSALRGEVAAVPSKSDAHRLFICGALADEAVKIEVGSISADIEATIDCIRAMGAEVTAENGVYTVIPIWRNSVKNPRLFCAESGSTLRFLLPVAAALFERSEFDGTGRLPKRPLSPLKEAMEINNGVFSSDKLPLSINGRLKSGRYTLAGNVSSQFISGLLFALPMLAGDSEIVITTPLESESYINMTVDALERFGVTAEKTAKGFYIKGGQRYTSPGVCRVEGDWSNSAFWLCAGALSGGVRVTGLNCGSKQGDKAAKDILHDCGAGVFSDERGVSVSPGSLSPMDVDASDIPDLVPVLSVAACAARGDSVIKNVSRLRLKESDRVEAVVKNLRTLGADIKECGGNLYINGKARLIGGSVWGFADHRIVMSAAIASVICDEPVIIKGAEAVDKSYKHFFDDFVKLGGRVNVL